MTQNVGIGGAPLGNRLVVQRAAGADFVGEVYLTEGTSWMIQNTRNSAGSYNPLFQVNDSCIVYSNGTQNNGAFAIGQWSTSERGIRIDTSGNFQFNSGYGSVATAYGCRAWVNFNGTGTVAIRGSGNISSITDNGVGDYTLNFTTATADANYSLVASTGNNSNFTGGTIAVQIELKALSAQTTSGVGIYVAKQYSPFSASDIAQINAVVFR